MNNPELARLDEADSGQVPWRRWGPYLSERQWGTVREDYEGGDTWSSFTHEQARYRAYRWGEDGLAGISDDKQRLCLALALWNGRDPMLKERLFGLTNSEGNHGEDVKECYFYLDAMPTSSYLRMLYKYPQAEFPYGDLVASTARAASPTRSTSCSTPGSSTTAGTSTSRRVRQGGREDILMQVTVHNRGPEEAALHVLPTLWFRHTWSWAGGDEVPSLSAEHGRPVSTSSRSTRARPALAVRRDPRSGPRHRERDQQRAGVRHRERDAVRQGRHRPRRRARRRGGGQPGRHRNQGGAALRAHRSGGRHATVRVRLTDSDRPPPERGRPAARSPTSTR